MFASPCGHVVVQGAQLTNVRVGAGFYPASRSPDDTDGCKFMHSPRRGTASSKTIGMARGEFVKFCVGVNHTVGHALKLLVGPKHEFCVSWLIGWDHCF
jgi:hypothetical protein